MAAVHKFDKASIIRSLRTMQSKSFYNSRQLCYSKLIEQAHARQNQKLHCITSNQRFGWFTNFWTLTKSFFNSEVLPGGSELLMRNYGYVMSSMRQCRNAAGSYFGRNEAVITGDTMLAYDYLHDSQSFLQDGIYNGRVYYCGKQQLEESAEDNYMSEVNETAEQHEQAIPLAAGEHTADTVHTKEPVNDESSALKEAQCVPEAAEPALPPTAMESNNATVPKCSTGDTTISLPGFIEWLKNLIAHIRMYFQKF